MTKVLLNLGLESFEIRANVSLTEIFELEICM